MDNVPTLEELKKKAAALPDELFPKWIFEITFHSFADSPDYWSDYDYSDPRANILMTIPKVKDIRKYLYYKRLYDEYINDLADKYQVDVSLIPQMFQMGMIKEYVPDIPKYSRKSKEVKRYLKNGELPTEKVVNAESAIQSLMQRKYLQNLPENTGECPIIRPATKEEEAVLNKGVQRLEAQRRMNEFKSAPIGEHRLEFVGDYYTRFDEHAYDQKPQIYTDTGVNFSELLRQAYEDEVTPDFIKQHDLQVNNALGTSWNGSHFVTKEDMDKKLLSRALAEAGFNPALLQEGGIMTKKEALVYNLQNGIEPDGKWSKKKKKKEKKLAKKHIRNLGSMASLLTQNGFSDGYENINPIDTEDLFRMT